MNFEPYVLRPEAERALKQLASYRECAKDCPETIVVRAGGFRICSPATEKGRYVDEDPEYRVPLAVACPCVPCVSSDAVATAMAHKIKRPVSLMIRNADPAALWLDRSMPDIDKANRRSRELPIMAVARER